MTKLTRYSPRQSGSEFRVTVRAVLNGNYDSDTVTFVTADPDHELDEWLSIHYGPGGLEAFKFKAGDRGQADELLSIENPESGRRDWPGLTILILAERLARVDPRDILRFGKTRQQVSR